MGKVTIWHNPGCGSSKAALAYLADKGVEADVYLYLKEKPGMAELKTLLARLNIPPSGLLRPKEPIGDEMGLYSDAGEDAILAALAAHPKLIQRPVVITDKGAVIARPKGRIDDIL